MTANLLSGGTDVCNLRRIILHGCSNITDRGVSAVACNCNLLNNIDISDCCRITDVSLSAIADNCAGLHTINLSNSARITDVGITEIGRASCRERVCVPV